MEQIQSVTGCFYGVGVGPGDPELMTFRAVEVLQRADVLAIPQSNTREVALHILRGKVNLADKELLPIDTPMKRGADWSAVHEREAAKIKACLDRGQTVAMPNLGDVSLYSTFGYLQRILKRWGYETKMVPGIPAFCAVSAALNQPLVEGKTPLHLVPAGEEALAEQLALPGTKILMKPRRELSELLDLLRQEGLLAQTSMVQNCSMEDEAIFDTITPDTDLPNGYFSTFVVREEDA